MKKRVRNILVPLALLHSILLLCFQISNAQNLSSKNKKAIKLFSKAFDFYQAYKYKKAEDAALQAIDRDEKFKEPYYLLSDIYSETNQNEKKINILSKLIENEKTPTPAALFILGKTELSEGKYAAARQHLEMLNDKSSFKAQAKRLLPRCQFGIEAMQHPEEFSPQNLGESVNSKYNEYLPAITADETMLIYTRLLPYNKIMQEDFYLAQKKDPKALKYEPSAPLFHLNTPANEGAQSLSADGKSLYFVSCQDEHFPTPHGKSYGGCDIYVSYKRKNRWTKPKNLGSPVNTKYWESQPSFSADGKTLYFASNRPGGKGKTDIWKSTLQDDSTWSAPENLGDIVNTSGHEKSPFIHPDNRTLYFSSDGHPGMGKLDLFVSKKIGTNQWSQPQNLGYPINTHNEEMGLIVNARGNKAFFASSQKSEFGGMDLYSFTLSKKNRPEPVTYVAGKVYDKITGKNLSAQIKLIELKTEDLINHSESDKSTGKFLVCLPSGKEYAFHVSKPGYLFFSENFSLPRQSDSLKTYTYNIALSPIVAGQKTILRNVFFSFDSEKLDPKSYAELDKLKIFLEKNPELHVEISGHTDNIGKENYNQTLSLKRAKSVVNYLIKKGIDKKRMQYKGYGSTQPLAKNNDEDGRKKNRRTECKIVQKK